MHDDPFELQRFVDAQADVYEQVCDELHDGRKASHWMWFVFPQLPDSATARPRSTTAWHRWTKRAPISSTHCWASACANAPVSR